MSLRFRRHRIEKTFVFVFASLAAPVGLATLATTQPGCFVLGSPGPSMVSQGQRYQAGEPTFDEFFTQLYDAQIELAKAPESEKKIREKLAKKIKIDEGNSATLLGKQVGKRADELAAAGTGLKLEVKGLDAGEEPAAEMSVKGKDLEPADKEMVSGVEEAARDSAKLFNRMRKTKKSVEGFNAQILALEQTIDSAFRVQGPRKKAEVKKNLDDAKKLIPLMIARADEVAEAAKTTAKKLADAAATDNGQFDKPPEPPPEAPPPEEPPPEETKKKGDKSEKPDKPKGDRPKGDKPPPSKPPPSGDFEP